MAKCEACDGTGKSGTFTHHTCYHCSGSGTRKSGGQSKAATKSAQQTQGERVRSKRQAAANGRAILAQGRKGKR